MNYTPGVVRCCVVEPVQRWGALSPETKALFDQLGIETVAIRNEIDLEYPYGNKICSLRGIDEPAIFLDSDMMLLRPFTSHYLLMSDFAAKPADIDTFSRGGGDWHAVYRLFGMRLPKADMVATATGERMRPYFNAGFIAVNEPARFCEEWLEVAQTLNACKDVWNKRPWLDQIAAPVAALRLGYDLEQLPEDFNYPSHLKAFPPRHVYFSHYHSPDIVACYPRLKELFFEALERYPLLYPILGRYPEWSPLLQQAPSWRFS
ncbi:hypothetical protein D1F64_07130 [Breoghania sp. L-A4]|nr:hypothetical protein D1F64_07130 [Breoghania sp. L-A4]